jgi:hypothetical protein
MLHSGFATVGCANDRLWNYFYLFLEEFRGYLVSFIRRGNSFNFSLSHFDLYFSQLTTNLELFRGKPELQSASLGKSYCGPGFHLEFGLRRNFVSVRGVEHW